MFSSGKEYNFLLRARGAISHIFQYRVNILFGFQKTIKNKVKGLKYYTIKNIKLVQFPFQDLKIYKHHI